MNLIEGLNIEYINVGKENLQGKMNLTSFHDQTFGYLNGGATIAFGEVIAGYASNKLTEENYIAVGQTVNANHIKSKKIDGYIVAKGKLMHKGRTSHVWHIEMFDDNNILISIVTVTNKIIKRT